MAADVARRHIVGFILLCYGYRRIDYRALCPQAQK
jgi:hypothetical protein